MMVNPAIDLNTNPTIDPLVPIARKPPIQPMGSVIPDLGTTGGSVTGPASSDAAGAANVPAWLNDPQFSGMDPKLRDVYKNSTVTPGGRQSGFADWQYWQDVGPSQYDRLAADLAGTGTDQPTGTPGSGVWQNSGAADRAKGGSSFWNPGMSMSSGPSANADTSSITDSPVIRQLILNLLGGLGGGR